MSQSTTKSDISSTQIPSKPENHDFHCFTNLKLVVPPTSNFDKLHTLQSLMNHHINCRKGRDLLGLCERKLCGRKRLTQQFFCQQTANMISPATGSMDACSILTFMANHSSLYPQPTLLTNSTSLSIYKRFPTHLPTHFVSTHVPSKLHNTWKILIRSSVSCCTPAERRINERIRDDARRSMQC